MISNTERSQVKRGAKRACYEQEEIFSILDGNLLCHVAYVDGGECRVIPTAYVRLGHAIYLHGHRRNRMLTALNDGRSGCISVTELNGLVLARSGFHHSVNYRSVVLFGSAEPVEGDRKAEVLDALVDHMLPGRSRSVRPSTTKELEATLVLRVEINEASAKIRRDPPVDAEDDYNTKTWAGVLNLRTVVSSVEACPRLPKEISMPDHVRNYVRRHSLEA